MPGQSARGSHPGFAGLAIQIWPLGHGASPRLPQIAGVGVEVGFVVEVSVG